MRHFVLQEDTGPVTAFRKIPRSPSWKLGEVTNNTQLAVVEEEDDPYFFTEFINFCSNRFCFDNNVANVNTLIEDHQFDDRNSLTYHRRGDELESNARNKNDDTWSCDSTLNSSGLFSVDSSIREKFRFIMDPKLSGCPDDVSVATLVSTDHHDDEEDDTSLRKRWDAIFAPAKPYSESNYRRISHDNRSCKTEGAKGRNLWNLSIPETPSFDDRVLGTSSNDESTKPRVLTSSIMDALQGHLPYCKQGEMFWLKYSLVRDGANLRTVLEKTKRSAYTILAVETLDGEVFGAFTAKPWHITWKYYGTPDSFLWRLRKRRKNHTREKPISNSDLEVFRFAGNNKNIQLCNVDRLAIGGGSPDDNSMISDDLSHVKLTEWGFGLAFGRDLQQGTSSPCMTFNSPSLSKYHDDGSRFEVANLEFWTLTPCISLEEAKRMEKSKQILEDCSRSLAW